tara:strand:+ start:98 stop:553 length:456 start_codon:yes stop_codon:yes gene_type:complete
MTKLCPRGKAAAKRKFKVYPSAYANAYASKICAGKIKDPSGVKRKDFKGPKPAKEGMMTKIEEERQKRRSDKPDKFYRRSGPGVTTEFEQALAKAVKHRGLTTSDIKKLMDAIPNYKVGGHNVTGSPVSVDVDGDTLSNPSASAYYKDLLK